MAAGSNTTIAKISGRAKPSAMACPRCGSTLNGVTETRTQSDNSIRRKRTCASCRGTWMTAERALSPGPGGERTQLGLRTFTGHDPCPAPDPHTGPGAPLALFLPWLEDHERELLLLSRQLRPEDRRVLRELTRSLGAGAAAEALPDGGGTQIDQRVENVGVEEVTAAAS